MSSISEVTQKDGFYGLEEMLKIYQEESLG